MKKALIIIFVVFLLLGGIAAVTIWGLVDYMEKVPVITPKTNIYAEAGTTLSISDLADIEKATTTKIFLQTISDDVEKTATVSADRQTLFVGYNTGPIEVLILATGENAESREDTVTVNVYVN
ncbi:MAG: hypothetical protein IJZ95_06600 [Oscillospiraceae bacterium]|nr:hypothetical protein [Oscillospiraceae bacterium]